MEMRQTFPSCNKQQGVVRFPAIFFAVFLHMFYKVQNFAK